MATEYTRVYTYTGQASWTAATRSIPLSKFAISGDTTHTIGQITSVTYKHLHSSANTRTYALSGRLALSDGTTIDSASVTQTIKSNSTVWFTNAWETLPTADQWAMVANVQTIFTATGSATTDGSLTWTARSGYPITVTITYLDEPPVTYAPKIDLFDTQRINADGILSDDGSYIAASLKLSYSADMPLDQARLTVYASTKSTIDDTAATIDLSSRIPELLNGLNMNTSLITGEYSPGINWYFAVEFIAGDETALAADMVPMAFVTFHQSKSPTGGVAIGMYSTATEGNPKFEVAHPAYFYDGVEGVGFDVSRDGGLYAGRDPNGKQRYSREMVYAFGGAANTDYFSDYIAENVTSVRILDGTLIRASDGVEFPPNFYRSTAAHVDTHPTKDGRLATQGSSNMAGEMRVTVLYTID